MRSAPPAPVQGLAGEDDGPGRRRRDAYNRLQQGTCRAVPAEEPRRSRARAPRSSRRAGFGSCRRCRWRRWPSVLVAGGARMGAFGQRMRAGADVNRLHLGRIARRGDAAATSTSPPFITVTVSASAKTRSMSCSTSSTGVARMSLTSRRRAPAGGGEAGERLVEDAARGRSPARAPCRGGAGRHLRATRGRLLDAAGPMVRTSSAGSRLTSSSVVAPGPAAKRLGWRDCTASRTFRRPERREKFGDLERSADAGLRDASGRATGDRLAAQRDAAASAVTARDEVERGRSLRRRSGR